ncbi:exo-alpha-sialidase [Bacteroidota bacterium]
MLTLFISPEIICQDKIGWDYSWPRKNEEEAGYKRILRIKYRTLFKSTDHTDTYHHHPSIAYYNNMLFTSWSSSKKDEDASGQHIWFSLAESEEGKSWTAPEVLFPPQDSVRARERGHTGRGLTPLTFCEIDNSVYAVAAVHDWTIDEERIGRGRIARSINASGELGDIFWLDADAPEPISGFSEYWPADQSEYTTLVNKINNWLSDPMNSPAWDFKNNNTDPTAFDGHKMCERTKAVILANGNYLRMYRDCSRRLRNYVQISEDSGATWDLARSTNIPDSNSKTYLGMFQDSTIYMINNAVDELWRRDPLSISILNNRNEFDWVGNIKYDAPKVRFEGAHKGPGFQYPSAVTTEKYLWVIYSVGKEDIEVARVPLSSLPNYR